MLSIPIAAGLLYPLFGWLLPPMPAAGAMALSLVSVLINLLRLRGFAPAKNYASVVVPCCFQTMDNSAIVESATGLALAAPVVWHFFFSARQTASAESASNGVQEVGTAVLGGGLPDVIEMASGKPVQLSFCRDEGNSCSEELLVPCFSISRELPASKTTLVKLLPQQAGLFALTCQKHTGSAIKLLSGHYPAPSTTEYWQLVLCHLPQPAPSALSHL